MSITLDEKINFWTKNLSTLVDVEKFDAAAFAHWLKSARENAQPYLSVTALANKASVSKQYVSLLEKGGNHLLTNKPVQPSLDKVERIAIALDADVREARRLAGYEPDSATIEDAERVELMAMYSKRRKLTPAKKEAFKRILDMVDRELDKLYEESLAEQQGNKSQTNGN